MYLFNRIVSPWFNAIITSMQLIKAFINCEKIKKTIKVNESRYKQFGVTPHF